MPAMLMDLVSGETCKPERLWEILMVQRGFMSSPSGKKDAYRAIPATIPDDLSGPGAPVGKGYETLAIIQILDKGGQRVGSLGLGFFEGGGAAQHAEAQVLKMLKTVPEMRNGRMMLVVDTPICPSWTSKLLAWAKSAALTAIDAYVPERQYMTSEAMATPKTTARTAAMAGRPELHLRFQGLFVS